MTPEFNALKEVYNPIRLEESRKSKAIKVMVNKFGLPEYSAELMWKQLRRYSIVVLERIIAELKNDNPNWNNDEESRSNFMNNVGNYIFDLNQKGNLEKVGNYLRSYEDRKTKEEILNAVSDMSWNNILSLSNDFGSTETINNDKDEEGAEILIDYRKDGKGFYWVDLKRDYCDTESKRMGHCGRGGDGNTLISLRKDGNGKESNTSHVTVVISEDKGVVKQIKGKANSHISEKYHWYVVDLLASKYVKSIDVFNPTDFSISSLTKKDLAKLKRNRKDELIEGFLNGNLVNVMLMARKGLLKNSEELKSLENDCYTSFDIRMLPSIIHNYGGYSEDMVYNMIVEIAADNGGSSREQIIRFARIKNENLYQQPVGYFLRLSDLFDIVTPQNEQFAKIFNNIDMAQDDLQIKIVDKIGVYLFYYLIENDDLRDYMIERLEKRLKYEFETTKKKTGANSKEVTLKNIYFQEIGSDFVRLEADFGSAISDSLDLIEINQIHDSDYYTNWNLLQYLMQAKVQFKITEDGSIDLLNASENSLSELKYDQLGDMFMDEDLLFMNNVGIDVSQLYNDLTNQDFYKEGLKYAIKETLKYYFEVEIDTPDKEDNNDTRV